MRHTSNNSCHESSGTPSPMQHMRTRSKRLDPNGSGSKLRMLCQAKPAKPDINPEHAQVSMDPFHALSEIPVLDSEVDLAEVRLDSADVEADYFCALIRSRRGLREDRSRTRSYVH